MSKLGFSGKEARAFFASLIIMIFVGFVNGVPFIFGDAYGYYHVGDTVIKQGTYPATTQPEYYQYTGHAVNQTSSSFVTAYSVGQSILYYPFLTAASLFNNGTVFNDYYKAFNGHSFADGMAILTAAIFFAYLGLIFCYLFLKEIGFSKKVSFFSTLAIGVSVYLLSYTFEQSGYSHVYEFFAYSAFLYFFIKFFFSKHSRYLYWASAFAGLLVLIRISDAILILIPFLFVLYKIRSKKVVITSILILGFFAAILLIYNQVSYGNPLTLGYTVNGQNGFSLGFNLINLLFSDTRGLFVWSPLVLLAVIGLIMYSRKSKVSTVFFLLPAVLLVVMYNFWGNWWGGVSTGQRFFIVLAPIFALGVAYLHTIFRFKFILKLLIFILVTFSFTTGILYRLTPVLKIYSTFRTDEQSVTNPVFEDYRLSDLYRYHARLFNNKTGTTDYINKLKEGFNGGRSIALLVVGQTDPLIRIEKLNDLKYRFHFIPSNLNRDDNINVMMSFTYKDITRAFLITGMSFKNYSSTEVTCTTAAICTGDNVEFVAAFADKEKQSFVRFSDFIKISVYGENQKINYVNLKLK